MIPAIGEHLILQTFGKIKSKHVIFVGVEKLYNFRYAEIRAFSKEAMKIVGSEFPNISNIAMTIHGVGWGLDEEECFLSQLGGFLDAFREGLISPNLKKIIIVDINEDKARRLEKLLKENLPVDAFKKDTGIKLDSNVDQIIQTFDDTGEFSEFKPHIFVIIPFTKNFKDIYEFGIKMPVKAAGYICERVDETSLRGNLLKKIKSRIETSKAVIADLSGGNPNVYFEVGYALGKGQPTILLANNSKSLSFDIANQKCIIYDSIIELKEKLEGELQKI